MTPKYYVVLDIGCLECEEESSVLGIFTSQSDAEAHCEAQRTIFDNSNRISNHKFQVVRVDNLNEPINLYEAS